MTDQQRIIGESRRDSYADIAYDTIANKMFTDEFPVGSRLVMDHLAERLDMSRTPIRDALRQLAQEGVIESAGRRGYIVRRLDADEIRQTFEARETIEGGAARLAAKRGQQAVEFVRAAIKVARQFDVTTPLGAFDANRIVHRAVVQGSGNVILLEYFDALWQRGRSHSLYAKCFIHADGNEAVHTKHAGIVRALAASDSEAAYLATREHIREGLRALGTSPALAAKPLFERGG